MYGTVENRLTFLLPSSGSAIFRELFMKINASKSWKMVGTSPNVAKKMNISSARDRKVSFSCGELDTENDGEASIGIACEQALLFGRVKRSLARTRERACSQATIGKILSFKALKLLRKVRNGST